MTDRRSYPNQKENTNSSVVVVYNIYTLKLSSFSQ